LRQELEFTHVGLTTLAIVSAMLLSEVYGDGRQASEKRAILETIVFATAALGFAYYVLIILLHANRLYTHLLSWSLFSWVILPFAMPLLCAARALLILCRQSIDPWNAGIISHDDLVRDQARLVAQARMRNRRDVVLLTLTGLLSGLVFWLADLRPGLAGSLVVAIYAVAPFYLLLYGDPRPVKPGRDFLALREAVRHELTRQHQLEAFVGWLRPAPLLLLLYSIAFRFSAGPTQRLWLVYATMAAMFGAFLVLAMNRDLDARLRLTTARLDRLRERPSG